ncbi:hypothetical protein JW859_01330 [bacterium]|nr:hypothetical protein [bacterium]
MIPTLFIGLGGTGKEIGLRLKRNFLMRSEQNVVPERLKFLYFDTDTEGVPKVTYRMASGDETQLGIDEPEEISGAFEDLDQFLERARDGMEAGVPREALAPFAQNYRFGSSVKGAGTIRQKGRLCFMRAASRFYTRMDQLAGSLTAVNPGEPIPGEVLIFIAASLVGGTGSSSFLDVANFAYRRFGAASRICLFLFLPDAIRYFRGTPGSRISLGANAYVALRELEYFQNSEQLDANFQFRHLPREYPVPEMQSGEPLAVDDQHFLFFLVSGNTRKQGTFDDLTRLYDTAAEACYRFSHYEIASDLFGRTADLEANTGGYWRTGLNGRSGRYGTLGLTELSIPQDLIIDLRRAQILQDIRNELLGEDTPSEEVNALAWDFFKTNMIDEENLGNPLLDALYPLESAPLVEIKLLLDSCRPYEMTNSNLVSKVEKAKGQIDEGLTRALHGDKSAKKDETGATGLAETAQRLKASLLAKLDSFLSPQIGGERTEFLLKQRDELALQLKNVAQRLMGMMQEEQAALEDRAAKADRLVNEARADLQEDFLQYSKKFFKPWADKKKIDTTSNVTTILTEYDKRKRIELERQRYNEAIDIYRSIGEFCDERSKLIKVLLSQVTTLLEASDQNADAARTRMKRSHGLFDYNIISGLGLTEAVILNEPLSPAEFASLLQQRIKDKGETMANLLADGNLADEIDDLAEEQAQAYARKLDLGKVLAPQFMPEDPNIGPDEQADALTRQLAQECVTCVTPWWHVNEGHYNANFPPVSFHYMVAPTSTINVLRPALNAIGLGASLTCVPQPAATEVGSVLHVEMFCPLYEIGEIQNYAQSYRHRKSSSQILDATSWVFGKEVSFKTTEDISQPGQSKHSPLERAFFWSLALNLVSGVDNNYFYGLLFEDIEYLGWDIQEQANAICALVEGDKFDAIGELPEGDDGSGDLPPALMSPLVFAKYKAAGVGREERELKSARLIGQLESDKLKDLLTEQNTHFTDDYLKWLLGSHGLALHIQRLGGEVVIRRLFQHVYDRAKQQRKPILRRLIHEFCKLDQIDIEG